MMILGLDISTSCTGWSLFNLDGTLVSLGYIRLDTKKNAFSRVTDVSRILNKVCEEKNIFTYIILH